MLDELIGVIETLKSRMREHRSTLSAYETRTRNSLIDPLLTVLGWDVSDPAVVITEYNVGGGRADYALLSADDKPRVFIEAKRLGEPLTNHRSQLVTYAVELGTPYSVLSNGDLWEIYDTFKQVPMEEKRILDLSIVQDPTPQIALKFLLLWRANVTLDTPEIAPEPIVKVNHPPSEKTGPRTRLMPDMTPGKGWTTLEDFEGVKRTDPPKFIRFGMDEERPLGQWNRILIELAEHLARQGLLTADRCPVKTGANTKRYVVSAFPKHASGAPFHIHREISNGLHMEVSFTADHLVRIGKHLWNHFGQDPSQVWLKTG